MRYLRKFNENDTSISGMYSSFQESKNKLDVFKDFCKEHLLFLIDENFTLQYYYKSENFYRLYISKAKFEKFNWEDVNSDILQFMDFLKNEYVIKFLEFRFDDNNNYEDDFTVPVRDFFEKSFKWDNLDLLDEEIFEIDAQICFIQMDVIIS